MVQFKFYKSKYIQATMTFKILNDNVIYTVRSKK